METIKKWEDRVSPQWLAHWMTLGYNISESAMMAEIADLRAALAKADEHCEEVKRLQHEQACRVTHALMAERDEWKVKASQAQAAPVVDVIPRAPWDDDVPGGMLESDNDYVSKNIGVAVMLLDAALDQRAASAPTDGLPSHIPSHAGKVGADTYAWQGNPPPSESVQSLIAVVAPPAAAKVAQDSGRDAALMAVTALAEHLVIEREHETGEGRTIAEMEEAGELPGAITMARAAMAAQQGGAQ